MANFFHTLETILKKDKRFVSKDTETLLRNKVYESAVNMDAALIKLLLSNNETKERFFTDVDGILVFDKIAFGWVVNNHQFLPGSYTRFKNRIGLTNNNDELISASNDVVLSFPFKDCVLEGGQTKEDQKRDEVFYNVTLAPDDVDRLLYPKVLAGAKRYSKKGVEDEINFTTEDNLIIKGNNLLAISSLLKRYEGKIKFIYIDPPYNTGGAANTFAYNNTFNHSTWLIFMKNRLEIAKKLLNKSGAICIAIDDEEYAHLKILCDEIFERENYVGTIIVQSNPRGRTINSHFATCHEYALFYSKNIASIVVNDRDLTEEQEGSFNKSDKDGKYRLLPFRRSGGTSTPDERPNSEFALYYSIKHDKIIAIGGERIGNAEEEYKPSEILQLNSNGEIISLSPSDFFENNQEIITILPIDVLGKRRVWRWSDREAILNAAANGDFIVTSSDSKFTVQLKDRIKDGRKPKTIWTDSKYDASANGTILLKNIFDGDKLFSYPKSIYTVKDTIEMFTNSENGDIVLDFFAGSGTTAHAVLDLNKSDSGNRKFILCEQMDYTQTVTLQRIKTIMNDVNNATSFVYCELAKCNQNFIDKTAAAKTDKELIDLLDHVLKTGFISYKVFPADISEAASEFAELSFADKKRFILELLDKNMLYVNLCDMNDNDYAISKTDKVFTSSFYNTEDK